MKKTILIVLCIFQLLLSGCFNYKDINRILFVTCMLVDINEREEPVLYTEVFTTTRAGGERMGTEERLVFKSTGKTVFEAVRNLGLSSNYKLNFSQNKSVVFTEKATRYGLDNFIDIFDRDQEAHLRQYIFVLRGDPEKFMDISMKEEKFIGIYLSLLAKNQDVISKGTTIRIDEFFNNRTIGKNVNVVNIIAKESSMLEERVNIKGLAVIKNDKYVGEMTLEEGKAYNAINNRFKGGIIEVPNPEHPEKFVDLEILRFKVKTNIKYDGKTVSFNKHMDVKTTFAGAQKSFYLNSEDKREQVSNRAQEAVKKSCEDLFNKYKEKGIDIFNIEREFEIAYPRAKLDEVIENANIKVDVRLDIEGSSDKTYFK